MMIPALEEVARFSLKHPSVKGATIDLEMYGYDPFKIYPQAIGFEDVSFSAFLRAAAGHLDDATIAEAASLDPRRSAIPGSATGDCSVSSSCSSKTRAKSWAGSFASGSTRSTPILSSVRTRRRCPIRGFIAD